MRKGRNNDFKYFVNRIMWNVCLYFLLVIHTIIGSSHVNRGQDDRQDK